MDLMGCPAVQTIIMLDEYPRHKTKPPPFSQLALLTYLPTC